MDWVVLYLNRATKDLYRVMREEAPPELRLLFLDAGGPDDGLDVYSPESLPAGHPLTRLDNVVLTPHVAAGTLDAFRAKMRFALGNIAWFKGGEEPLERAPTPSARVPDT